MSFILQIWTCAAVICVVPLTSQNVNLFADYMLEQNLSVF